MLSSCPTLFEFSDGEVIPLKEHHMVTSSLSQQFCYTNNVIPKWHEIWTRIQVRIVQLTVPFKEVKIRGIMGKAFKIAGRDMIQVSEEECLLSHPTVSFAVAQRKAISSTAALVKTSIERMKMNHGVWKYA